MILNNAAARLYDILSEARTKFNPRQHEVNIREVWASVLDVEEEDTVELLHFVAHLLDLVRTAKLDVQELPNVNTSIYLRPFAKIEKAFSNMNLEIPWHNFTQHLDEATMVGLQFCADTLSLAKPEPIIDKGILTELQSEVEALIEKIVESDFSPHVKNIFLTNLENIRLAILEYRINGSAGLSRALDTSLGSIFRNRDEIVKAEDREIFPTFFKLMFKINELVTYSQNARQLLEPVVSYFLPSLPSGN